jgi:hypothetical protein
MEGLPIYSPEQFGKSVEGADDAPRIQQAINAAEANGGGLVLLQSRSYNLQSSLILSGGGVVLCGTGWGAGDPFPGTWLHVSNSSASAIRIQGGQRRSVILRDFAIRYDQPPVGEGWAPISSPYSIDINGVDDVLVQNVLLFNVTYGIRGFAAGRLQIDRLFGQPLLVGIELDLILDVARISNVHFWPFWTTDAIVQQFTKLNATGVVSRRCDNPHFSNLFFLAYFRGMQFASGNEGVTSKFRISQVDCDFCRDGIYIDAPNTTGQIVNFTAQGSQLGGSTGLFINGAGVKVQISNFRATDMMANAVRVQGNGDTMLTIENSWVDGWDREVQGYPAIEAVDHGTKVYVGKGRWFFGSGGGPVYGGDGTIIEA